MTDEDLGIDFSKLRKEFGQAKEKEERYWRENDAKFRAVHQRVGSYEEFRDIVLASHIKPLERGDKMPDRPKQPWNVAAIHNSTASAPHTAGGKTTSTRAERDRGSEGAAGQSDRALSSHAFHKTWRQLVTKEEKFRFLCSVGGDRVQRVFRTEISSDLLSEVLQVLNKNAQSADMNSLTSLLLGFSQTGRFALNVQFFGEKDRHTCSELLLTMKRRAEQAGTSHHAQHTLTDINQQSSAVDSSCTGDHGTNGSEGVSDPHGDNILDLIAQLQTVYNVKL